ncbi:SMR family transporter [Helicobacter mastomyrinus]|uniref:Guanidinium exporter n=1 Tax=Helicobacter mastomyrinus TaxID=287948 RepID=A0ABZ3F5I6_9HELI
MSWVYLLLAGLMEIAGVILMKKYSLTGRKIFLLGIVVQFGLSLALLSLAMQGIAMATAYAIWTGIGTAGVCLWFFKESKSVKKLFFIALIIVSVVGLKVIG